MDAGEPSKVSGELSMVIYGEPAGKAISGEPSKVSGERSMVIYGEPAGKAISGEPSKVSGERSMVIYGGPGKAISGEPSQVSGKREKRPRQRKAPKGIDFESSVANLSREGRETLMVVNRKKRLNTIPGNTCSVFDHTCPRYKWLHPGWICEERVKPSHRLYRYFYDPLGQMYNTKGEVAQMYADTEKTRALVIYDK
ncbi:hypothetical protein CARUB_v10003785mg [Capsella rubella]|uniref:MBD domain-containing protein n=1 Tax=Capsella rubella TaxID=81985 RepID=R0FKS1_9BRAS|nr:uncharacterized protein LOC17881265 [Capsella rubella]EOA23022.1 hypothetical protein CARUB_v10003785mg [Capsella rubella]